MILRWLGLAALLLALACVLLALACGGPQDETPAPPSEPFADAPDAGPGTEPQAAEEGDPVRGDWLVIHHLADPENLNPYTSSDFGATQVMNWIYQTLLTVDPDTLEPEPLVARALPEVSEDRLTYTFALRDDVTFSDGAPLTADDVVFSMKTIRHPKVAAPHLRNYYNSVRDARAVDAHTVRFDLREPYFRNRWTLGLFEILPRHYYDPENLLEGISVQELDDWDALDAEKQERAARFAKHFNEDFQRNPLGSGAYALVDPATDFVTGERIVLRHRDNYWAPDDVELEDGWVDRVVYRIINDREAALVALKSHNLDFIEQLSPVQATRGTNDTRFAERFGKNSEIRGQYYYLGWNQKKRIFQDKRVRQALSHLVDKQNLVDKVMLGLAEPIESPIYYRRPEYNASLPPWEYSPEKARALLAEAGWEDTDGDGILEKEVDGVRIPLRFEIISNAGNDERRKIGLAVIDSFKRNGVDASFRAVDWSILLEKVKSFDYDAVVLGWAGGAMLPPDAYQIWHSSQAVADGSNHVAFVNPEVDGILEEYRVTFDPDRRKALYDRFQEILYEEQPYTFLFAPAVVSVWDRRFSGVEWYPGLGTEYNKWWVPEAKRRY